MSVKKVPKKRQSANAPLLGFMLLSMIVGVTGWWGSSAIPTTDGCAMSSEVKAISAKVDRQSEVIEVLITKVDWLQAEMSKSDEERRSNTTSMQHALAECIAKKDAVPVTHLEPSMNLQTVSAVSTFFSTAVCLLAKGPDAGYKTSELINSLTKSACLFPVAVTVVRVLSPFTSGLPLYCQLAIWGAISFAAILYVLSKFLGSWARAVVAACKAVHTIGTLVNTAVNAMNTQGVWSAVFAAGSWVALVAAFSGFSERLVNSVLFDVLAFMASMAAVGLKLRPPADRVPDDDDAAAEAALAAMPTDTYEQLAASE